MTNLEYIVEVRKVKKSFKDVKAVNGVDLQIRPGEFLALLGPNGAGKTTLVEMIEGIQHPDEGEILIDGKKWKSHQQELHHMIGLSLQETRFMDKLTAYETLRLFASFYKLDSSRVNEVFKLIGLGEKKKAFVNNLYGGQRQRLAPAPGAQIHHQLAGLGPHRPAHQLATAVLHLDQPIQIGLPLLHRRARRKAQTQRAG